MLDWLKKRSIDFKSKPQTTVIHNAGSESLPQVELSEECATYKKDGDAYLSQGEFEKASVSYLQAIACNPDYAEAYNNLGNVCREQNLFEDAERYLKQAIKIKPELANVYYNLASLVQEQGRLDEAAENFSKTLTYEPTHGAARALMLYLFQKMCKWEDLNSNIKILRHAALAPVASEINIFSPFLFLALPSSTLEEQKICAEKWVQFEYQPLVYIRNKLAFDHKQSPNKKTRIGYLSADFRQHPVSFLMAEVFELHDRNRFHITAYSYDRDERSAMRERLENAFDDFVDIRNDSDIDVAKKIYADHIDILVDLTGYTQNSRSAILALRPAPIQVNYLGYPGTMGADFVDYLIADHFIIPLEHQKHYTERIAYLPDCFQANDRTRSRPASPTREDCGLPEDGFVFCCFNQTYKITPEVFEVWCQLLKAVPLSVLWLPASNQHAEHNLRREVMRRGVAAGRIVIAAKLAQMEAHLARLQCADLFLDTTPYNAHTTCSDALWMGLPVVTCVGETFASRVAGSLLTAIGAPELIAYDLKDYYDIALDLSTDRKKLDAIRNKIIANRDTAPLFDSERFTRNLEKAYIQMKEAYLETFRHSQLMSS